jgi:hypothetical protein
MSQVFVLPYYVSIPALSPDIETLFDLVPSPLNHVWSYRCDGCCDPIPYAPEIPNLFTIRNVLDVSLQKKSIGV